MQFSYQITAERSKKYDFFFNLYKWKKDRFQIMKREETFVYFNVTYSLH